MDAKLQKRGNRKMIPVNILKRSLSISQASDQTTLSPKYPEKRETFNTTGIGMVLRV